MQSILISSVVNNFKELPLSDKEYAFDILQKQMIEEKRKALAHRVKEVRSNFKSGKIKKGTAKDLLKDLESD